MNDLDLRAMSVRCPLCASAPQQPCHNEQGVVNPVPHVARIDAYLRIRNGEATPKGN